MNDLTPEIITAAAQGDEPAFGTIYQACGGFVFNTAFRLLGSREEAQEVSQEVFLAMYRKMAEFSFRSSFKTWVYRITVNRTINYLRKRRLDHDRTEEYDDALHIDKQARSPEDQLDQQNREMLVTRLLNELNPDQRNCMVLRNIEELSYEEIAAVLDININTVRSRLKRGREKLLSMGKEVAHNEM